jgi:hypothetical protein
MNEEGFFQTFLLKENQFIAYGTPFADSAIKEM